MELIKAVDAKLGDVIAMIVHAGDVANIHMGELKARSFEDNDGWISLTIQTINGPISADFPFDDLVVREG